MNKWIKAFFFFFAHMQFNLKLMAFKCWCHHSTLYAMYSLRFLPWNSLISSAIGYKAFLKLKTIWKIAITHLRMIKEGPHFWRQHVGWFWWHYCRPSQDLKQKSKGGKVDFWSHLSLSSPPSCVLSHYLLCHLRNRLCPLQFKSPTFPL